jgi:hypothetical protein
MTTTAKGIIATVIPATVMLVVVAAVWLNYRRNRSRAADTANLDQVLLSSQPASGTKKDIRLTPKQILGLDIETQLDELPTHHRKDPERAVPGAFRSTSLPYFLAAELIATTAHIEPPSYKLSDPSWRNSTHIVSAPAPLQLANDDVNAWDVERGSNPVILAHLAEPPVVGRSEAGTSRTSDHSEDHNHIVNRPVPCGKESTGPSNQAERLMATLTCTKQWTGPLPTAPIDLEMLEIPKPEGMVSSGSSMADEGDFRMLTPATTASSVSGNDKGKSPALESAGPVELVAYTVAVPDPLHVRCSKLPESNAFTAAVSTFSTIPQPFDHTPDTHDTPFACLKCIETFQAPGRLRYVGPAGSIS